MVTGILSWLFGLMLAGGANATAGEPIQAQVEVAGLRGTNGVLRVGIFRAEGFPGADAGRVCGVVSAVTGAVMVVTLGPVAPGEYAVLAYHDENGNGRLDHDLTGRPREGYGVSGGVHRRWRAPRYEEAKVGIRADSARVRVPLAY